MQTWGLGIEGAALRLGVLFPFSHHLSNLIEQVFPYSIMLKNEAFSYYYLCVRFWNNMHFEQSCPSMVVLEFSGVGLFGPIHVPSIVWTSERTREKRGTAIC
ncbi:hypothetical protein L1049_024772 [Liquidambar formosana]|uniref:Uncharacterized protein n=1 Tax=Liquidambar formosana TaxID=63359 RepID=A0AAP0WZY6_LIQFO